MIYSSISIVFFDEYYFINSLNSISPLPSTSTYKWIIYILDSGLVNSFNTYLRLRIRSVISSLKGYVWISLIKSYLHIRNIIFKTSVNSEVVLYSFKLSSNIYFFIKALLYTNSIKILFKNNPQKIYIFFKPIVTFFITPEKYISHYSDPPYFINS